MNDESIVYAKSNKRNFIKKLIEGKQPSKRKTAIFMAGSPGAGKTEVAISLEEMLNDLCVIDADRFRSQFPGYDGSNSSKFQRGAALLVDYSLDYVFTKGYSFILDGTFAIEKSVQNIERALKRDYFTAIYYVYQDPFVAWSFTKQREIAEGRNVPKDRFINAYFKSRENIIRVAQRFGEKVEIIVVIKDYQNAVSEVVEGVENLDLILPRQYSFKELEEKLDD